MKILRWIAFMIPLIFLPTGSYPSTLGHMHISLLEGDVQIYTEDTSDWVPASINMPMKDGDRIWVPIGGRLELRLRDGTAIRLDEKTGLDILTLEKDAYQFYLADGRVYVNFRGVRGTFLQIDTPMSSIRVHERAIFRIDILDSRHTEISVYEGSLYAENKDGRIRVDPDRTLALREGSPTGIYPLGPPDEWERWNQNRNRIYSDRRTPSSYLPEELQPYSSDFEDHGRWVYVRGYGYVWTPTIIVSTGWAPYRIGRWVWIRGDYVWVSYEPWGWIPYHYGRWMYVAPFGWCWVPPTKGAVYWGPGFVGWIRTPTYISWVPLAPGEIYYGYGYYGPYSVNITHMNVRTLNVERVVYRNVRVQNAVTIIHHDTFVHGRHVEITVRENPFLRERIHIGRPDIKPEKPTAMPMIREIPQPQKPPEKINEIKVREIREKRPLTRERESSVMKEGPPPREMDIRRREGGPIEKRGDRTGERPGEKIPQKEPKPSVREIEKPMGQKPTGKVEKPIETKPVEKGGEAPKEIQSPPPRTERQLGIKPQEKPTEKTLSPNVDRLREDRKSIDLERDKSKERPSPVQRSEPVQERKIEKPPERRGPEREPQTQKESNPERGREREQEPKSPGKENHKKVSGLHY